VPTVVAVKLLGIFITACVVLAAAQAVLSVLFLTAIVYGIFVHPRETFALLAFCLLAALVECYPLPCIGLAALTAIAAVMRRG
jgi:hypothetical protein